MGNEVVIKGRNDIDVIKNRIYEVRGQRVMLDRDLAELYNVETKRLNEAVRRNIERFPEDFMFKLNKSEWVFLRSQIATLKESTISTDTEDVDIVETSLRSQIATSSSEETNTEDTIHLKSQFATSSWGGTRKLPNAFTELGIAMLSSVLRSETAIQVNINIMRAFVAIRHAVAAWQDTNLKVEQLSHKVDQLNNYVEEILRDQNDINQQQDETNAEIALQIEAINDALDQLREKPSTPRKRIGFKQDSK